MRLLSLLALFSLARSTFGSWYAVLYSIFLCKWGKSKAPKQRESIKPRRPPSIPSFRKLGSDKWSPATSRFGRPTTTTTESIGAFPLRELNSGWKGWAASSYIKLLILEKVGDRYAHLFERSVHRTADCYATSSVPCQIDGTTTCTSNDLQPTSYNYLGAEDENAYACYVSDSGHMKPFRYLLVPVPCIMMQLVSNADTCVHVGCAAPADPRTGGHVVPFALLRDETQLWHQPRLLRYLSPHISTTLDLLVHFVLYFEF